MLIDNESPPGSWEKEWDARSHTVSEYQKEIRDLRDRIRIYMREIESLNRTIESMRDEIALNNKYWQKMMDERKNSR
jgi:predicted RNase H-like nuclease (RuvC/YqgF family)